MKIVSLFDREENTLLKYPDTLKFITLCDTLKERLSFRQCLTFILLPTPLVYDTVQHLPSRPVETRSVSLTRESFRFRSFDLSLRTWGPTLPLRRDPESTPRRSRRGSTLGLRLESMVLLTSQRALRSALVYRDRREGSTGKDIGSHLRVTYGGTKGSISEDPRIFRFESLSEVKVSNWNTLCVMRKSTFTVFGSNHLGQRSSEGYRTLPVPIPFTPGVPGRTRVGDLFPLFLSTARLVYSLQIITYKPFQGTDLR